MRYVRIYAQRKLAHITRTLVRIQNFLKQLIVNLRRSPDNPPVLKLQPDSRKYRTVISAVGVKLHITVNRIFNRRRINLAVGNIALSLAFDGRNSLNRKFQMRIRRNDSDPVGLFHQLLQTGHRRAHFAIIKQTGFKIEVFKFFQRHFRHCRHRHVRITHDAPALVQPHAGMYRLPEIFGPKRILFRRQFRKRKNIVKTADTDISGTVFHQPPVHFRIGLNLRLVRTAQKIADKGIVVAVIKRHAAGTRYRGNHFLKQRLCRRAETFNVNPFALLHADRIIDDVFGQPDNSFVSLHFTFSVPKFLRY